MRNLFPASLSFKRALQGVQQARNLIISKQLIKLQDDSELLLSITTN